MNLIMKYINEDGETVTFRPQSFDPLSCEDFVAAELGANNLYPMSAHVLDVEIIAPDGSVTKEKSGKVSMPINFKKGIQVYALVEGGWLPVPFTSNWAFLVDRNVIGRIEQISKGNPREM